MPLSRGRVLVGIAIMALALNLRVAVSSVGVVLGVLQQDLGISPTAAGVLATLPMICFAIFGLATSWIVSRLGLHRTVALALLAIIAGLIVRVTADGPLLFFAMSFLCLSGAAIGNVVLPPLVKVHFPDRIGLLSSLYGAALMTGATIGSILTVPVFDATGGWRLALGMWAALAIVTLVPWLGLVRHDTTRGLSPASPMPLRRVARSPLTWAMACCFGIQSGGAYAQFGWFAQILTDGGVSVSTSGLMLGVLSGAGIPATLALPWFINRWGQTSILPIAFGGFTMVGWLGVMIAPSTVPWLWAVFLGVGGSAFTWVLAMIGYRTLTAPGTSALSTLTQGSGYIIGAAVPVLIGFLHDVTGTWTVSILVLIGAGALITVFGIVIARSAPLETRLRSQS